jgi:hypothetical protein
VGAPGVRRHRQGKVVAHGKHDKVRIFKMRRRKHYQKRQGHRQNYTELRSARSTAAIKEERHGTEKGGGSTRNGRDSKPKMLGVKAFGGQ